VFICHAVLLSFLIGASLCDLEHYEIPLNLTVTGTLVGLTLSTLFPWPYPDVNPESPPPVQKAAADPQLWEYQKSAQELAEKTRPLQASVQPWPLWNPLPDWLPPGSWRLGLATGFAGALAGIVLLRGVRFLFGLGRGMEGLGVGDADLMMMAGAFIGWQPVVIAFFLAVFPALVFGPSLAAGVVLCLVFWPELAFHCRLLFFSAEAMIFLTAVGGGLLLLAAFLLRLLRGRPEKE
jgi:leader peptidase (prepilin peptidase)/N-methyltransferase